MTLTGYFEDEHIVLINQAVRPMLGQVTQASKELSDSNMVVIEVALHGFYTHTEWGNVCVLTHVYLHACKHTPVRAFSHPGNN